MKQLVYMRHFQVTRNSLTHFNTLLSVSGDSRDGDARRAFESLLLLTLTVPSGPVWTRFSEDVVHRAQRDYNFTYDEEVQ